MDGGHQKALRAKAAAHYWIDPPPLTVNGAARLVVPARKLSLARCLGALLQAIRAPPRTCGRDGLPAGCPPLPPQNGRLYGCSAGASLSGASDPPSAAPPRPRDTRPSQRPASHRRAAGNVSAISQLARPRIWQPSKQPSSPTESGEPCRRFPLAHRAPCRGAECSAPCRQSRASHQATETHHHPVRPCATCRLELPWPDTRAYSELATSMAASHDRQSFFGDGLTCGRRKLPDGRKLEQCQLQSDTVTMLITATIWCASPPNATVRLITLSTVTPAPLSPRPTLVSISLHWFSVLSLQRHLTSDVRISHA